MPVFSFCFSLLFFISFKMSSLFSSFRSVQRVLCPTIHRPSSRLGKVSFLSSQSWLTESSLGGVPVVTNLIRGTFTSSLSSPADYLPVIDPSKNEILRYTPQSTQAEIKEAILAASDAFPTWKATPIQQRQRIMFQYQHLIRANMDRLMHIITLENGKTLADAKGDIFRGLEIVETCCDMAHRIMGENLMGISDGMDCMSYRVPLGVCAGIAPFNFPAMIPLWMFPIAITAGNTFVMKPSEKTPGATMMLAELALEAGLPPGVLNIVHGGKATVDSLCDDPAIKAISFVGSNIAGEYIFSRGTSNHKRVQANLGAKNHVVVMPDADREATVKAIVGAAFGAAGQRCMAVSVAVFVDSAWNLVQDIAREAKKLRLGCGFDVKTDIGPLITSQAKERCQHIITQAVESGAQLLLDGRFPTLGGNYVGPTILVNVDTHNVAYREEIFGPVLVCMHVKTLKEAMHLIHLNPYGNGTAIFTQSGACARAFATEIEVGQVGINVPIPVPLAYFSFTGNKNSIKGDINFYGRQGLSFYTQLKTITSNWKGRGDFGGVNMPLPA